MKILVFTKNDLRRLEYKRVMLSTLDLEELAKKTDEEQAIYIHKLTA